MGRLTESNYSFSHSEMEVHKQCRRRWYLKYYLKLRRNREPRAVARDTGILVHSALHEFYLLGGLTNRDISVSRMFEYIGHARDTDLAKVSETERKDVTEIHEVSRIVLEGYVEWLEETGADSYYTFNPGASGTEVELRAPGPIEGTEIMGYLDLAGTHNQSGDLVVMDTKVVASIDDMIKNLAINEQGPMYAILSKITDPDPDRGFRVVWNFLKRNKQTARAKPPFYQRYELAINQSMLQQFYVQLQGQMEEILRTEARLNAGESHVKVAYPTPSKDCGWKCEFFALCGQMNDPRTDSSWTISQYYTTPEQRAGEKAGSLDTNGSDTNQTSLPGKDVPVWIGLQGTQLQLPPLPIPNQQAEQALQV